MRLKKVFVWCLISALFLTYVVPAPPPVSADNHVKVGETRECFFGLFNCTRVSGDDSSFNNSNTFSTNRSSRGNGIVRILGSTVLFINYYIIPFLFAIAFVFFLWNAFRYFIFEANSEDGRKKAGQLALYGIFAFVLLVSIWGIVNILVRGFGIDRDDAIVPDYIQENRDPWEGFR